MKPLFKKTIPISIPTTNPAKPAMAFQSPPANLKTILVGHPKNINAPTITINPRQNLISGEDPPLELNSLLATARINEPNMNPMISGLTYCTIGA